MGCSSGTLGAPAPQSMQHQHSASTAVPCSGHRYQTYRAEHGQMSVSSHDLLPPRTLAYPFSPHLCPAVGMGPAPWDTPAPWALSMALAVCGWLQQRLLWLQSKGPVELGSVWQGTGTAHPRCTDRLWAVRAALGTQPCPVTRTSPGGRTGLGGQDV